MNDPRRGEGIPRADYFRCDYSCVMRKRGGSSENGYCDSDPNQKCEPNNPQGLVPPPLHAQVITAQAAEFAMKPRPSGPNGDFDLPDPDEFKPKTAMSG